MIDSRKELRECLDTEAQLIGIRHYWLQKLYGSEDACIYQYMWVLRHLEYFISKREKNNWLYILPCYFFDIWHRRLSNKRGIFLGPNCAEKGFRLVHLGYFRSWGIATFGKNTTVLPMVLFGKKNPGTPSFNQIRVGDNCYFATGCTILAPCKIGNNVTVAAGAVVTMSEIPDNAVVAGVPAKIVKIKE